MKTLILSIAVVLSALVFCGC